MVEYARREGAWVIVKPVDSSGSKGVMLLQDWEGIRNGAMNVELIMDTHNRVWPIDIGPRNGGNMIPDLMGHIFGVNVVEMTVKAAMGQKPELEETDGAAGYATCNLYSDRNGVFAGVEISRELEPYVIRKTIYK